MASAEARRSLARAAIYGALASVFLPPEREAGERLRAQMAQLTAALEHLGVGQELRALAEAVGGALGSTECEGLHQAYDRLFEASGGLACPLHETSVAPTTPQEGLTRTYEMADVAGFYRAFGVEVAAGAERPDHLAAELEFMHLLAVKEAVARDEDDGGERVAVCRDASRTFLRDHLGRWTARFAERLESAGADTPYAAAGRLVDRFVAEDAAQLEQR